MDAKPKSNNDRARRIALAAAAIAVTLISGAVYGHWTQRWGPSADLLSAVNRVAALPHQMGDWRMLEERPMNPDVLQILECAGATNRVYVHQKTGAVVNMAFIVGPPGPTSVHTPEICYSSLAFQITEPRSTVLFKSNDGSINSLWETTFRSRNAGSGLLRVYYGWDAGNGWKASASPRFEFGGQSLLYKLQVAAVIGSKDEIAPVDPCREFVDAFLQASAANDSAPHPNR